MNCHMLHNSALIVIMFRKTGPLSGKTSKDFLPWGAHKIIRCTK
jgi:hypothetical protein